LLRERPETESTHTMYSNRDMKAIKSAARTARLAVTAGDFGRRNAGGASGFADRHDAINARTPKHRGAGGSHWLAEWE